MSTLSRLLLGAALASASCAIGGGSTPLTTHDAPIAPSSTDLMFASLRPTALSPSDATRMLDAAIASHFQRHATRRGYVMTDKPLYQPGETIWFRVDLRATGTLIGAPPTGLTVQLVSPRGAIALQQRIQAIAGVAQSDFALDPGLDGGEYTIRLAADDGTSDEKKLIVNTYEAPRLQKTLEFVRKAYGAGDAVAAAIEVRRATGEPFARRPLTAVVTVDDAEIARLAISTDGDGKATARFTLPPAIARGDGLLTILADDGGVTESIQKRIPILISALQLQMFPEGGDLVDGLPGRVYFLARNPLGKPADVEGRVVDDRGQVAGELRSIHDGMGRFDLQPATDRSYHVEITRPAGIAQKFDLPAARPGGCVLRSVPAVSPAALRVAATCTTARSLIVEAVLRETRLAAGAVEVTAGTPALLELPVDPTAQGAVRVTLFSARQEPLAERLVYHGRGQDLTITLAADRKTYSPRDPVKLRLHATDPTGKPVKASLGVAVVDDTVLTFADDKSAGILAHLYLEPELGATAADPIEEPNFYFSDKPEAPAAMDALLATRGYRRFDWQPVLAPPPPPPPMTMPAAAPAMEGAAMGAPPEAPARPEPMPVQNKAAIRAVAVKAKKPAAGPRGGDLGARHKQILDEDDDKPARKHRIARDEEKRDLRQPAAKDERRRAPGGRAFGRRAAADRDDEDPNEVEAQAVAWAPVRVFPVPPYTQPYDGPRTDFRETIYWNGNVQTSADGNAEVAFVASDAITSFRATAEGVSAGGLAGRGTLTFQSKMPMTLDAHLPLEVTSGDEIRLPVTLANETDRALDAMLDARFGAAFQLTTSPPGAIHLAAGQKQTVVFPLRVVATDGAGDVDLALTTAGLQDQLHKQIRVVPLGFPFEVAASGTAKSGAPARHDFDLAGALPGSIRATVTMYPSPLAAMTKGMEGMIREPGGCFEQTSSTNYPNIMILGYLGANDATDPALLAKTQGTLDRGYKLLTGYETKQKGYEWFGQTPGHEALTAYGLMEFADMAKVYDVDRQMVERTADWLMTRRDHKGGFLRSSEALDSFGRAGEATTSAYIVWALAEAHRTAGLDPELAAQRTLGADTRDPYLLALATNTNLLAAPHAGETAAMVHRLVAMQAKDGSFPGATQSITMSGGESLTVETTALATLALIKASPASEYEPQIRAAVDWLNARRGGYGQWSNTQATVLGLKALTAYAEHSRQMQAPGSATLIVNGKPAGTIDFDKGRKDALVWDDLASALRPGPNTIELQLAGGATLPYSIAIEYRSAHPQSSPAAKVAVTTQLVKTQVRMGEGVKLRAHVENTSAGGVPMTLARIGIPGGLTFQTWQLKELRDKGAIDFYETRPREVILYWRALPPSAKKDVDLDLLAAVPGHYEAPASSAYLYYTAEDKAWTAPVQVTVDR
ncbi:MAG TPA: MG2 domain-containing protein [Kofleriaceae bacterium]|nr:MG2 domain-containing protein [Kofleriaceae bacterium]